MINDGLNEAEADMLADFIGGALEGTPEASTVAELIATDDCWRQAYLEMGRSVQEVVRQLERLHASEPMPNEIAKRIHSVLEGAREPNDSDQLWAVAMWQRVSARLALSVRRIRHRRLALAGAASMFAAILSFGIYAIDPKQAGNTGAEVGASGSRADSAPNFSGRVTFSGTDYSAHSLAQRAKEFSEPPSSPEENKDQSASTMADSGSSLRSGSDPLPASLRRFEDHSALESCLDEIRKSLSDASITIHAVELSRFQGAPAVVVFMTDQSGMQTFWVSGAECGTSVGGDAKIYSGSTG
ncbi:hypothetical protein Aca07nite_88300 [Actinoplanes capillaceus]|uniref:Uncharacterized protein n=1 Tax=Actinoplanes campanulatus TaxID=113559 RepID=A0ABQ3WZH6_9ACTN|nr:hypothetical protein [Actinoplanes capillaceus]GID51555.1 hypothetical protein Aca07nite_88300 [Actinoplanes capillaceus]